MSLTVTMPQLGETVTEGTILRWAKQPGDAISEDEVLLEISTDKVDTEVPSPAAGTILEILVAEGATVAVGTPLVVIGEPGEVPGKAEVQPPARETEATPAESVAATPATQAAPSPAPPEPVPSAPAARAEQGAPAAIGMLSPVVRRLAAEHGIDLSHVSGSGSGGRITRRDVEAFVEGGGATEEAPAAPVAEAPVAARVVETPRSALGRGIQDLIHEEPADHALFASERPVERAVPATGDRVEDLSRLRVRIAENMIHSKQTAAHVFTSVEVDYEHVERVRQRHRQPFKEREGFSLTYLPFISRATVDALGAFPVVNSSFDLENRQRTMHSSVNLGYGVDLDEDGLLVMTVRGADGLRMRGLAREVRRVAEKARSGKIEPDDVTGSTFTITNPGPFGSFMSVPIINVPNVAILSTETVVKRPVVVTDRDGNDAIAIHHIGYLGLTWDHRAFDGSTAVRFLDRIRNNLHTWDWEQELA
ncbi:MAG: dihydrolipoamide acetyltransferase family protein [Acidimicrobiia bacterium]|nr:MAG: dihydrolipoamide acetyltransferase family protein [Acidimicrobiia bacterium]